MNRNPRKTCLVRALRFLQEHRRWLLLATIVAMFAWFLGPLLPLDREIAWGDTAHYYVPLWQYARQEWAARRVPLWNPQSNLGMPLAAGGTASVFYPGWLLLAMPIGMTQAAKLYVLAHLVLATAGTYRLARRSRVRIEAAGMAAVTYTFSGVVLFLHTNVVFLVGAAWLPWALTATERLFEHPCFRRIAALAVLWAMMVLGGDPQMAYHAAALALLYGWIHRNSPRFRSQRSPRPLREGNRGESLPERTSTARTYPSTATVRCPASERRDLPRVLGSALRPSSAHAMLRIVGLVGITGVFALVLSAVQAIPSWEFARHSGRVACQHPRTLYELASDAASGRLESGWPDGLLCRRVSHGSHLEQVYQSSVAPWQLAELIWPNCGGRPFPENHRWFDAIPAQMRWWTPSLYLGIVPLLIGLGAMRLARGRPRRRWFSWMVFLAVLGSLGSYGPGWLIREAMTAAGGDPSQIGLPGGPVGGVYWLLTLVLPGYIEFRYPAKLLVVAALGICLLAARGWDVAIASKRSRFRRLTMGLCAVSAVGAIVSFAARSLWTRWLAGAAPNVFFGPMDVPGAAYDLSSALGHTALVCCLAAGLLRASAKTTVPLHGRPRWRSLAMFALVAIDLTAANGWMVTSSPRTTKQPAFPASRSIRLADAPAWTSDAWSASSSSTRLAEVTAWQRASLCPNYHLPAGVSRLDVPDALVPFDYQVFRSVAPNALFGVDASSPPPLPRAWIVHNVVRLDPLESRRPSDLFRQAREVVLPAGQLRDFRCEATVEPPRTGRTPSSWREAGEPAVSPANVPSDSGELCHIVRQEPLVVEIDALLHRPGLVVLADQYWPGWQIQVQVPGQPDRSATVLRTNRVMRGVWLPAGRYHLVYRYRPNSFFVGAVASVTGWLLLGLGMMLLKSRPHRAMRRAANAGR